MTRVLGPKQAFEKKQKSSKKYRLSVSLEKLKIKQNKGIILALLVSFPSYMLMYRILPTENIAWWALEIWTFVLTLIFLGACDAALKKNLQISSSVFLFILLIFLFRIIAGYSERPISPPSAPPNVRSEVVSPQRLDFGENVFYLEKIGDETKWLRFPTGRFSYKISSSSPDYNYYVLFSDGRKFKGGEDVTLPYIRNLRMKLVATEPNQLISISVTAK